MGQSATYPWVTDCAIKRDSILDHLREVSKLEVLVRWETVSGAEIGESVRCAVQT